MRSRHGIPGKEALTGSQGPDAVEDYVEHDPFPGQGNGLADLKARVAELCRAFKPMQFTVEDVICRGRQVVVRWTNAGTDSGGFMGMPATGRASSLPASISTLCAMASWLSPGTWSNSWRRCSRWA